MYSILIEAVSPHLVEQDRPRAVDPRLCSVLVDERDVLRSGIALEFSLGPSSLQQDYLMIRNVSGGKLCSQRFITILTQASVPFTAYPTVVIDPATKRPFTEHFFFWIPRRIPKDEAVDWERSEDRVDPETGKRRLKKIVLQDEFLANGPQVCAVAARYLIHDTLRETFKTVGMKGMAFAPLDAADDPHTGIKREDIRQRLLANPEIWKLWVELGKLLEDREALLTFNQALSLKPDLEEAWYRRGRILQRQGAFQEALASLQHAMHDHLQSGAWEEYGVVLREMGQMEEALTHARQWVQLWEEAPRTWWELGRAHAALDHYEEAIQAIDHGFALIGGADRDDLLKIKGDMLYRLGRYQEALDAYTYGIKFRHHLRPLYRAKVEVLRTMGQEKQATEMEKELQKLEQEREENLRKRPI